MITGNRLLWQWYHHTMQVWSERIMYASLAGCRNWWHALVLLALLVHRSSMLWLQL
jgi:hypothetical protein